MVRRLTLFPERVDMNHDSYSDAYLRDILARCRSIAVVGASTNPTRPSFFVMKYLQDKGYRIHPVNPGAAGQTLLGRTIYGALNEIPEPVDMVDIFRNAEAAGPITDAAIALPAKVVWMQLGVRNDTAAARAEAAGLAVVMGRCPKIEHARLCGELGWAGFNTGVITSKKRPLPQATQKLHNDNTKT